MSETRLEMHKRLLAEAEEDLAAELSKKKPDSYVLKTLRSEIKDRKAKVARLEAES